MNRSIFLLLAALATAVSDARGLAQEPVEVGRYQLVSSLDGRIYLLDTATGQCWSRTLDGDWQNAGNPTSTRGRKPARQAKRSPPTLDLPEKAVEMIVVQREERAIPGSDGSVRIRLGDITDGQVLLSVVTADDEFLLDRTSVAQGDKVQFAVGIKEYTVQVRELRNILIGDDFARITVEEATERSSPEKGSPDRER